MTGVPPSLSIRSRSWRAPDGTVQSPRFGEQGTEVREGEAPAPGHRTGGGALSPDPAPPVPPPAPLFTRPLPGSSAPAGPAAHPEPQAPRGPGPLHLPPGPRPPPAAPGLPQLGPRSRGADSRRGSLGAYSTLHFAEGADAQRVAQHVVSDFHPPVVLLLLSHLRRAQPRSAAAGAGSWMRPPPPPPPSHSAAGRGLGGRRGDAGGRARAAGPGPGGDRQGAAGGARRAHGRGRAERGGVVRGAGREEPTPGAGPGRWRGSGGGAGRRPTGVQERGAGERGPGDGAPLPGGGARGRPRAVGTHYEEHRREWKRRVRFGPNPREWKEVEVEFEEEKQAQSVYVAAVGGAGAVERGRYVKKTTGSRVGSGGEGPRTEGSRGQPQGSVSDLGLSIFGTGHGTWRKSLGLFSRPPLRML